MCNVITYGYGIRSLYLQSGKTALLWASAKEGNEQVIDMLLKAGANLDTQDHVCSYKYHHSILADDVLMQEGLTALMEASRRGHKDNVKELLDNNANLNMTGKVGVY